MERQHADGHRGHDPELLGRHGDGVSVEEVVHLVRLLGHPRAVEDDDHRRPGDQVAEPHHRLGGEAAAHEVEREERGPRGGEGEGEPDRMEVPGRLVRVDARHRREVVVVDSGALSRGGSPLRHMRVSISTMRVSNSMACDVELLVGQHGHPPGRPGLSVGRRNFLREEFRLPSLRTGRLRPRLRLRDEQEPARGPPPPSNTPGVTDQDGALQHDCQRGAGQGECATRSSSPRCRGSSRAAARRSRRTRAAR